MAGSFLPVIHAERSARIQAHFPNRVLGFASNKFCAGKLERRPGYLDRILGLSEEEYSTEGETDSSTEPDSDTEEARRTARRGTKRFRIPKLAKGKVWNEQQLENFRKNWPHLRNFENSVLECATLSELTAMGKQKFSNSRLLSHTLSANLEHLQNFPEKIEGGVDDCLGKAHPARFLRGYVGDSQELWRQARLNWGADGIDPVANYEVGSLGMGDQLTYKVWAELHKPNSRQLSIRLLSHKSVEDAWKQGDKSDSPKEFENLIEFKTAMASLEGGVPQGNAVEPFFQGFELFPDFDKLRGIRIGRKTRPPTLPWKFCG